MDDREKINRSIQEGVFFFAVGAALLGYAVTAYRKAFHKDWGQSPYLFPMMVAVALMFLSLCLLKEGAAERKKEAGEGGQTLRPRAGNLGGVAVVLALCAVYYAALFYVKLPYVTVGIFQFFFTLSTFEAATWIFLILMMVYMGVRKPVILTLIPAGFTLFLSIAFRTLLNVLLP